MATLVPTAMKKSIAHSVFTVMATATGRSLNQSGSNVVPVLASPS
ncbi:hypothetical protein [Cellulomonas dongxiuzhuiae]|nr:hypothetical protein [Cellulomonas dongxiuzhuiae]